MLLCELSTYIHSMFINIDPYSYEIRTGGNKQNVVEPNLNFVAYPNPTF